MTRNFHILPTMSQSKVVYSEVDEKTEEISATISGQIPSWLKGTLIRNGPGLLHLGETKFNHWFDGLALLHRFRIDEGKVSYFNKFLRSEAYVEGLKQQRIVKSEFGTNATADPCKTIFSRFFSYFNVSDNSDATDNCLVNIIPIKEKQYAVTESIHMIEIDPNTLEVLGTVNIMKEFPGGVKLFGATAHPHVRNDGTVYNLSMKYGRNVSYNITSIPPKSADENDRPLDGGKIVASIPPTVKPTYFHSFGLSENYFIVCENPFCVNVFYIMARKLMGWSISDCFSWDPKLESNFHVIDRKTGQLVTTCVTNKPTFIFHHVNAFEKNEEIIMDACCYDDAEVVYSLYLKNLQAKDEKPLLLQSPTPQMRRYTLPLNKSPDGSILPRQKLPLRPDGLDHEVIYPILELPRINYENYNSKEYRYAYGLSKELGESFVLKKIVKLDVQSKEAKVWEEDNCYPSEPVFVPSPDAEKEDEGVVLSAVLNADTKNSFLLVLDGVTFQEVARADVPVLIPANIHGVFLDN